MCHRKKRGKDSDVIDRWTLTYLEHLLVTKCFKNLNAIKFKLELIFLFLFKLKRVL